MMPQNRRYVPGRALHQWKQHHPVHLVPTQPRQAPITDGIKVPRVREALHCLHMSCSTYYFDRAARGIGIPAEVSIQFLVMAQAIYDSRNQGTVLSDSIAFFSRLPASIENTDMCEAIRAARLALKAAMADTQTELPIVSVPVADPGNWLL